MFIYLSLFIRVSLDSVERRAKITSRTCSTAPDCTYCQSIEKRGKITVRVHVKLSSNLNILLTVAKVALPFIK